VPEDGVIESSVSTSFASNFIPGRSGTVSVAVMPGLMAAASLCGTLT
jgi:hypothetical protein